MKLIERDWAIKRLCQFSETIPDPGKSAIVMAALFLQNENEFPTFDPKEVADICDKYNFSTENGYEVVTISFVRALIDNMTKGMQKDHDE